MLSDTVPEPLPEAPETTDIHEALDFAVHGHPVVPVTEIETVEAVLAALTTDGDTDCPPAWKLPTMLYGAVTVTAIGEPGGAVTPVQPERQAVEAGVADTVTDVPAL